MTDSAHATIPVGLTRPPGTAARAGSLAVTLALWAFVLGNLAAIIYFWQYGYGDGLAYHWHSFDNVLVGMGRLTAFLSGYFALIEVVLLARLPFVERKVGFDKLTIWHRWNGHAVIYLALAHVFCTVWGYAKQDGNGILTEYWNWLTLPQPKAPGAAAAVVGGAGGAPCLSVLPGACGGSHAAATSPYPGIITATIGTFLLVLVFVTSLVVVKRKLSYEWWYAVHFMAYGAIALAWFHMIPDGNDLIVSPGWQDYWMGIWCFAALLVFLFRLLVPAVNTFRFGMRVTEVTHEGPGVVSLRVTGRNLGRLGTKAGQFFFWRFLTKGFWYTQHPFSISEAPDGTSLRITVKDLGDHTAKFGQIPIGTRVVVEGPFGVFIDDGRANRKRLLVAGGIGITPVRALLEVMTGDVVALYRVASNDDLVFADELERISRERGIKVSYVVGDHTTPEGRDLLSPKHLQELVPDIAERDVYICGPVGMIDAIVPNLRRANVSREHLHVERFAL